MFRGARGTLFLVMDTEFMRVVITALATTRDSLPVCVCVLVVVLPGTRWGKLALFCSLPEVLMLKLLHRYSLLPEHPNENSMYKFVRPNMDEHLLLTGCHKSLLIHCILLNIIDLMR